jgi:thymidylate synthase
VQGRCTIERQESFGKSAWPVFESSNNNNLKTLFAIFSFTATKPYSEEEVQEAYENWLPKLERALTNQLWNLIEVYGKAVREHPDSTIENIDEFISQLKEAAKIRNVICHGSWYPPDSLGASVPFFVNRNIEKFETSIDNQFLNQLQKHTAELSCNVVDSVTHMGWQFPGSNGPGKEIYRKGK